jgi:glucose-1-phosphate cytidylyltransferase
MWGQTPTKKELVEIGGRPVIWHVMRIFSAHGFNRFILTLGYRAEQIKRYFLEYERLARDLTIHLGQPAEDGRSRFSFHGESQHPAWEVVLADTGLRTEKASRIHQVAQHIIGERFFVAYGDDVSDVNLNELVTFHRNHGRLATLTAVQIALPYGVVEADGEGCVTGFVERPELPYWINGGFMLFEREALALMGGDDVSLETYVLPRLVEQRQLMIYRHRGFWQSMNTMKDNLLLEELWRQGAPWKVWS